MIDSCWGLCCMRPAASDAAITSMRVLLLALPASHGMRRRVHQTVGRPSVCLSVCPSRHSATGRRCGGFAAVDPAGRRYRSIAAQPAVISSRAAARRAAANAGSATLSAVARVDQVARGSRCTSTTRWTTSTASSARRRVPTGSAR